ncbi:MAG: alpha/beta fold hydrolase [Bacteroidales bacterium]|nr:alpha/beta fold hydrolase [Bacteroidales bacterium]
MRKRRFVFLALLSLLVAVSAVTALSARSPVSGPQGRLSMKLTLPDGIDPARDSCPMVILMHGIFSSKDYAPMPYLAHYLAKRGVASIRFDFDGHGWSAGKRVDMTVAKEIQDARAVWDYARTLPYVSRLFLLGHSQGGVVASMFAGELAREGGPVPDGLILLAPGEVIKGATRAGSFFGQRFDPKDPPEFIKCFGLFKLGRDYLLQTQQLDTYGTAALYQGPVCLIHGTMDRIVPLRCSEKYHEIYTHSQLHKVEGENHMIIKRKSEVAGITAAFLEDVRKSVY